MSGGGPVLMDPKEIGSVVSVTNAQSFSLAAKGLFFFAAAKRKRQEGSIFLKWVVQMSTKSTTFKNIKTLNLLVSRSLMQQTFYFSPIFLYPYID